MSPIARAVSLVAAFLCAAAAAPSHAQTVYSDSGAFNAAVSTLGLSLNTVDFTAAPDALVTDGVVYDGLQFVGMGQAGYPHGAYVQSGLLRDDGIDPFVAVTLLPSASQTPSGVTAYSYNWFYHDQYNFTGVILPQGVTTFDIGADFGSSYTVKINNFAYGPASSDSAAVPEPSALILLALGLTMGVAARRGRVFARRGV